MRSDRVRGRMQVSPLPTPTHKKIGRSPIRCNGKVGGIQQYTLYCAGVCLCQMDHWTYISLDRYITVSKAHNEMFNVVSCS